MQDSSEELVTFFRERCFQQKEFCDVVIEAFGKEFKAHKLVLLQSGYFEARFSERWSDKSDRKNYPLEFSDPHITCESLDLALSYLYGVDKWMTQEMSLESLLGLVAIAGYLDIPRLREKCQTLIMDSMSLQNAVEIAGSFFDYLYGPESEAIKRKAMVMLTRDATLLPVHAWTKLNHDLLLEIWEDDGLFVLSEFQRFEYLADMHIEVSREAERRKFKGMDDSSANTVKGPESRLEVIEEILHGLHYEHMNQSELESVMLRRRHGTSQRLIPAIYVMHGFWIRSLLRTKVERANECTAKLAIIKEVPDEKQGETVISKTENNENDDVPQFVIAKNITSEYSPFRFGWQFKNYQLGPGERVFSKPHFYGGSLWVLYMLRNDEGHFGIYLLRARDDIQPDAAYTYSVKGQQSTDWGEIVSEELSYKKKEWIHHSHGSDRWLQEDYNDEDNRTIVLSRRDGLNVYMGPDNNFRKEEQNKYITITGKVVTAVKQTPINDGMDYYYKDKRASVGAWIKLNLATEDGVYTWTKDPYFSAGQSWGTHFVIANTARCKLVKCTCSIVLK